jgi:hypothetical protein
VSKYKPLAENETTFSLLSLTLGIDISTFYSGSVNTDGTTKKYRFLRDLILIIFYVYKDLDVAVVFAVDVVSIVYCKTPVYVKR